MSELKGKVSQGTPLTDELVIDSHCHMGRWFNFNIPMGDADGMVKRMDRLGIRACVAAHHASVGPDFRYGNDEVLKAMAEFPDRIYGYATVNPNYPDELTAELDRCIRAGMKGIKIHPDVHQHPIDGEKYRPVWEYAEQHGTPVLSHTSTSGNYNPVKSFEALAERYPNAVVILGHSGFGSEGADQSIEAASKFPNIYLEITGSVIVYGTLERMVREAGADRVLFGTDLPFIDPRPQLGRVAFAKISDEEKRMILGLNSSRIFGIEI